MMLDFVIIAVLLLCAAVFLVPAALIIVGAVKRRKRLAVTCAVILSAEVLLVAAYSVLFPTCFPYVDLYTIGKSRSEIIAAYGEPDFKFPNRYGYYVGEDNGFFGVMDSNSGIYYYIHFDENGIAESVEKGGPVGG